jgi:chemotaxis signal transduction protein
MVAVAQVIAYPTITLVATGPQALLGVFNVRGEIVPLFDTASLIGTGNTATGSHVVVVRCALGLGGLVATGPPMATELDEPVAQSALDAGVAVYGFEQRLVTLLDVDDLLDMARSARLDRATQARS